MVRMIFGGLVFSAIFHFAYVEYISPVFAYAHYVYNDPDLLSLTVAYACAALPLACFRESELPSNFGASILYVLCYAPAQLIMLFTWNRGTPELFLVQGTLAVSMGVLFIAARAGGGRPRMRTHDDLGELPLCVDVLTALSLLALVATFSGKMHLVSFEDVYDLRSSAAEVGRGFGVDYLLTWLSYSFLPFYFAKWVMWRATRDLIIGFAGSVLLYAAMGSKAAILLGPIIYLVGRLYGSGYGSLKRLLGAVAASMVLTIILLPDEGIWIWAKSILLVRVLGTGGWTMSTYYDFFTANQLTYYSHIGPINAIYNAYPYGEYSLGQMIGINYSGSSEANFNANFWASDGFAALGIAGIPIATAAVATVLYVINRCTRDYSPRLVVMWLSGFWLALLNLPLSVALVSGGGLITLLLLLAFAPRRTSIKDAAIVPSL